MGQSGPLASFAGFGNLAAAISGFYNLTGWPDRPPAGPVQRLHRLRLAALHRCRDPRRARSPRRTGEGQYIDQSQGEACAPLPRPRRCSTTRSNGRVATRASATATATIAPHGVYPAAGDDRWVAIAVRDDERLARALRRDGAAGPRRTTRASPRAPRASRTSDELDALVAGVDARRATREEIEALLQARGVPASAVQNSADLVRDPQLLHRGHFVEVEHPSSGKTVVEGSRFTLSRTPPAVRRSAPTLGRDNQYVLEQILGYGEDQITELVVAGALQ